MRQCKACRSVNRKADEEASLSPAQVRRLVDAWKDGVPESDLSGRFGIPPSAIKAATAGLKREHVSGREP
jgi:hypothetical protein